MSKHPFAAFSLVLPLLLGASTAYSTRVATQPMVAFSSDRSGSLDIYSVDATGKRTIPIVVSPSADTEPTWSPDNGRIAFASDRDGRWHIWVANADGTKPHRVTTGKKGADTSPRWSPDGTTILFTSSRDGNWEIYKVPQAGGTQRNVTRDPGADDLDPTWHPNSRTFAFERIVGSTSDLYRSNARKPRLVPIVKTSVPEFDPAYSPKGDRIAFDRTSHGNQDVWVMNSDGTGQHRLTRASAEDSEPTWSPDGTKIVFTSFRDGDYEIYSIPSKGGSERDLTRRHTAMDMEPAFTSSGPRPLAALASKEPTHSAGLTCTNPYNPNLHQIYGSNLQDTLCGTPGDDHLMSRGGADRLWADDGRDLYEGGCGNDIFYARDARSDTIYGGGTPGDCGAADAARVDKASPKDALHGVENPNL